MGVRCEVWDTCPRCGSPVERRATDEWVDLGAQGVVYITQVSSCPRCGWWGVE